MTRPPTSARALLAVTWCALSGSAASAPPEAQSVEIYAAGSLRAVVTEAAQAVQAAFNIEVKPTFGSSGTLRERIEKGEAPDLFLSADLASPRKLETEGRTFVPAAVFARNRMCVVARAAAGVTAANMVDRMLAKGVRLKTSAPVADPSGDYAWAIFERIDGVRPGAGRLLKEKAQTSMGVTAPPASPTQHPYAALLAAKQIDIAITYCSGIAAMRKDLPELHSLEIPPQFDPHPLDGMALLSNKPEALRVALFLFSEKGQAIIARQGLVPLAEPSSTSR
jgi:ABC-type molybdate transport system substrate-binding protein